MQRYAMSSSHEAPCAEVSTVGPTMHPWSNVFLCFYQIHVYTVAERLPRLGKMPMLRLYRQVECSAGEWRGLEVAVKSMVFEADLVGGEQTTVRVAQEAAISESLTHPNVVETHAHDIHAVLDPFSVLHAPHSRAQSKDAREAEATKSQGNSDASPAGLAQVLRFVMVQEFCNGGTVADAVSSGRCVPLLVGCSCIFYPCPCSRVLDTGTGYRRKAPYV